MTRSVIIRMRRRAPNEQVEPFRHRIHAPIGQELFQRLEAWTAAVADQAEAARPEMPVGVEDRAADLWEPLLAVADLAGSKWPDLARKAAVALLASAVSDTPQSLNIRLLSDLRTVFASKDAAVQATTPKGLPTKAILEALHTLEDAPWSHLKEPLNDHSLSWRLREYGIKSDKLRPHGQNQCKGYRLADLEDVWRRYLPSAVALASEKAVASVTSVTSETFQEVACDALEAGSVTTENDPSHDRAKTSEKSDGVTDVTPFSESGERLEPQPANDTDKGVSHYLLRHLADWYLERFEKERQATGAVQQEALDAELRVVLAEHGVLAEFGEIEFERVMEVVHAPLGESAGREEDSSASGKIDPPRNRGKN
jgi:hypothetical protein